MKVRTVWTRVVLVLALLAAVSLAAGAVIPNRFLGDKLKKIDATVLATAGQVAVPTNHTGVYLLVTNDGENDIYVTINETATTAIGTRVLPNETFQAPVAVSYVSYICATGQTSLIRGSIAYY